MWGIKWQFGKFKLQYYIKQDAFCNYLVVYIRRVSASGVLQPLFVAQKLVLAQTTLSTTGTTCSQTVHTRIVYWSVLLNFSTVVSVSATNRL